MNTKDPRKHWTPINGGPTFCGRKLRNFQVTTIDPYSATCLDCERRIRNLTEEEYSEIKKIADIVTESIARGEP